MSIFSLLKLDMGISAASPLILKPDPTLEQRYDTASF